MFQDLKNKLIYSANLIFNAQPLEYFCDTECDVFLYKQRQFLYNIMANEIRRMENRYGFDRIRRL